MGRGAGESRRPPLSPPSYPAPAVGQISRLGPLEHPASFSLECAQAVSARSLPGRWFLRCVALAGGLCCIVPQAQSGTRTMETCCVAKHRVCRPTVPRESPLLVLPVLGLELRRSQISPPLVHPPSSPRSPNNLNSVDSPLSDFHPA